MDLDPELERPSEPETETEPEPEPETETAQDTVWVTQPVRRNRKRRG